jgi:hypothetical protein
MAWVLDPYVKLLLHFIDEAGKHAVMGTWVASSDSDPAAGGPATVAAAAQALSASALYETEVLVTAHWDATPVPTTGPYRRPADKAAYNFTTATSQRVKLELGAPLDTQFVLGNIVNPGDANVIALAAAMKLHGKNSEGEAITVMGDSIRRRPPRRKGQ